MDENPFFIENRPKSISYEALYGNVLWSGHPGNHDPACHETRRGKVMSQPLPIVAQYAMDEFYQNYRSGSDFFTLSDFSFHCMSTIAAAFKAEFEQRRAELRQDRQDEIVSFSHDWLSEQILTVEHKSREIFAVLEQRPMSFPFDMQDTGIQEVLPLSPFGTILERSSITEIWQFRYLPATDRIFWYLDRGKLKFFNKGSCTINEIRVLYVPTICETMDVPDGIIDVAVSGTVAKMKQLAQGVVIKKSLDENDNKTLETEIDRSQFK